MRRCAPWRSPRLRGRRGRERGGVRRRRTPAHCYVGGRDPSALGPVSPRRRGPSEPKRSTPAEPRHWLPPSREHGCLAAQLLIRSEPAHIFCHPGEGRGPVADHAVSLSSFADTGPRPSPGWCDVGLCRLTRAHRLTAQRHCEERRDAAIQSRERRTGLLRCTRNDGGRQPPQNTGFTSASGRLTPSTRAIDGAIARMSTTPRSVCPIPGPVTINVDRIAGSLGT